MATTKISQLPVQTSVSEAAAIPLVQGGITYQASVENILANVPGPEPFTVTADGTFWDSTTVFQTTQYGYPLETQPSPTGTTYEAILAPYIYWGGLGTTATTATVSGLNQTQYLQVQDYENLQSISFPQLYTNYGPLSFQYCYNLTTVNLPDLVNLAFSQSSNFNFNYCPITTIYAPLLYNAYFDISNYGVDFFSITQTLFPALREFGIELNIFNMPNPITINLPLVQKVYIIYMGYNPFPSVTSIYIPTPEDVPYSCYLNGVGLTSYIVGAVGPTKRVSWGYTASLDLGNNELDQASIDNTLEVYASLDGTNGTTIANDGQMYLDGGTSASPSASGLAAISVLQARGWYISYNP